MSLSIDIGRVNAVLLADGWHDVGAVTFDIDAYEFRCGDDYDPISSGVCSTGFVFADLETGDMIAGPMTSVLAVRYHKARPRSVA